MSNKLVLGRDKSSLVETDQPFLFIGDGEICDLFFDTYPDAKRFEYNVHGLNPLPADYKMRRRLPRILWDASGKDTLRVRDGKRALRTKLKAKTAKRLDKLSFNNGDADREASDLVDDLMDSPVLSKVLIKRPPRWLLSGASVIARLGPELEEFDALVLASLLAMLYPGHVVISDFGRYVQDFHKSLMRQDRISVGLNNLSELDEKMQQIVLSMPERIGAGCTYDDALELAKAARLRPDPSRDDNPHNRFIDEAMA